MMDFNVSDEVMDMNASSEPVASMEFGVRLVWDVLFISMIAVAIVGNLIVLWIIMGEKEMEKPLNGKANTPPSSCIIKIVVGRTDTDIESRLNINLVPVEFQCLY
jgi:hypothetical protein